MSRLSSVLNAFTPYAALFGTCLFTFGFVGDMVAPRAVGGDGPVALIETVVIDMALLTAFALQHS